MEHRQSIQAICQEYNNESARMLDILWRVQDCYGWISPESMQIIADATGTYRVEVEGVVTFYAFFMTRPQGKFIVQLCDDIIDRHAGLSAIKRAAEDFLGIQVGETTADGLFSLHLTPCIGMCDQAPAALINDKVVTHLTPRKMHLLLRELKKHQDLAEITRHYGEGNNSHNLVRSMVCNNIRKTGEVLLADCDADKGLMQALTKSPAEVLAAVKQSGLRGRGGAGFATGKKWEFAAKTQTDKRYVICNADEGEPGTFKDRVLLTEKADLLIAGMTICAYAIGSDEGILYLRAEYRYLLPYLESVLEARRQQGLLGEDILVDETENTRFSFDVRIQLGAGAYICGEESSLISSCEGKRGEPKNKPPFPAQSGYMGYPTIVNNVETFCNVARILERGAEWFCTMGTGKSAGTKLLSVAGDCKLPGIYELPMGVTVQEVLDLCGACDVAAVQISGASGQLIGSEDFHRRLCFEDLPTAGAITVFSGHRNILEIVDYYMHFFIEESCGYCTPCRVGNVFLQQGLEKVRNGLAEEKDLDYLKNLGRTVCQTSRCGLGHTSPNPILSSLESFPLIYASLLREHPDGREAGFDINKALDQSRLIAKRRSIIYDPDLGEQNG